MSYFLPSFSWLSFFFSVKIGKSFSKTLCWSHGDDFSLEFLITINIDFIQGNFKLFAVFTRNCFHLYSVDFTIIIRLIFIIDQVIFDVTKMITSIFAHSEILSIFKSAIFRQEFIDILESIKDVRRISFNPSACFLNQKRINARHVYIIAFIFIIPKSKCFIDFFKTNSHIFFPSFLFLCLYRQVSEFRKSGAIANSETCHWSKDQWQAEKIKEKECFFVPFLTGVNVSDWFRHCKLFKIVQILFSPVPY